MMKKLLLAFCLLLAAAPVFSQSEYEKKEFKDSKGTILKYRVLYPENYDQGKKYPIILFLHGAGERGDDNEKQLVHGSRIFTNPVNREKYPAIVLIPQCPKEYYWHIDQRPDNFSRGSYDADPVVSTPLSAAKELLDSYIANEKVDKNRIYIMGLSMGGMGTFDLVSRYPDLFAAAIPICGGVNPSRLAAAKDVKFRIFHGDADPTVPVTNSRDAYKALKKAGAKVELIEFAGCGHNSWDPAFNYPDFLEWLFKQKK